MGDESAAIVEIMQSVGVYDFVMSKVKDIDGAVRMFRDDFEGLMELVSNVKGKALFQSGF